MRQTTTLRNDPTTRPKTPQTTRRKAWGMTSGGYGGTPRNSGIRKRHGQLLDHPVEVSNCDARHVTAVSRRWNRGAPCACSRIAKLRPDDAKDARIVKSTPPTDRFETDT